MRYEALIAAVLVLSQIAPAAAAPRDNAGSPQFSAAETSTVGRNELLRALIETDPWLVREILDAVAQRDAGYGDDFVSFAFDDGRPTGNAAATTRTAAASVEWITLLRRVRDEKTTHARHQPTGRSAKGSVELLETLKKARKDKGGK
jgi:hypothetical protein